MEAEDAMSEGALSTSSVSSFSSISSSDESVDESALPIKRYKLHLHPNYNESDVSERTHMKWKKKTEEYITSQSIPIATSSYVVGADAPITVGESQEESNLYSEDSCNASTDNCQDEPSVINTGNLVSDENESNVNNNCTSNNKVSDDKYTSQNSFPRSSLLERSQRADLPLPDVIIESADKLKEGIGSIEDYYPFQFQYINNEDRLSSAPPKENVEEEEEELCSLSDDESDPSESESEAENVDDEELLDDKNQNFFNKMMFTESQLSVRDVIVLITAFSLEVTLDDVNKVKLGELIKVLAGKQFSNVNLSKYMMNKCFSSQEENMTYHFYCSNCTKQILYSIEADKKKRYKEGFCDDCKKKEQITNASSNYFLSIDLKYQIELLLCNPEIKNDIINNLKNRDMRSNSKVYEDIYSGSIHKNMTKNSNDKSEYILTVNGSTDGAPLTKSGKTAFWPVQLTLNDLSPKLRFKNVLLCGLLLTSTEPKSDLLNLYVEKVYVKQMQQLFQEGIEIVHGEEIITLKFCTHAFIVDAIARAILQNRIQFNGYYGCSFCYQMGKYFASVRGVRYPVDQDGNERTHESHMNDVRIAETGNICNGVKGPCVLQDEPFFDMVWSFPYEELHAMLLGSVLTILNEWKNGESEFKLSKAQIDFIEKRFLNIKPTDEIHRLPRSGVLKGTAKPKAAELKSWLVHYSLPCLCNVLHEDALDHFSLFVKSSYTLLSLTASDEDLDQCEIDLLTFLVYYAAHYGDDKITYNFHLILHMIASVRKTGPICFNSAFPFESYIYTLKTYVSGPKCMDRQIARKNLQTLVFKTGNTGKFTKSKETIDYCSKLFNPIRFSKSFHHGEDITYCGKSETETILGVVNCATYKKCIYKGTVYHSEEYKKTKKTNNSTVQMHSGEYGRIEKIFEWNNEPYLQLRFFHMFPDNPFKNVTHIQKIESEWCSLTLRPITDVKCKVMLINVRNARYVSHLPNTIEIQ